MVHKNILQMLHHSDHNNDNCDGVSHNQHALFLENTILWEINPRSLEVEKSKVNVSYAREQNVCSYTQKFNQKQSNHNKDLTLPIHIAVAIKPTGRDPVGRLKPKEEGSELFEEFIEIGGGVLLIAVHPWKIVLTNWEGTISIFEPDFIPGPNASSKDCKVDKDKEESKQHWVGYGCLRIAKTISIKECKRETICKILFRLKFKIKFFWI